MTCLKPAVSQKTAQITPNNQRCICKLADDVVVKPRPLLEIYQFPPIPGDKALINRGVRALCKIQKGKALGEYTGQLIPKQDIEERGGKFVCFRPLRPIRVR
jgi:hypothetical protein